MEICIILIIFHIISVIITIKISLNKIKKITFLLLEKYSLLLNHKMKRNLLLKKPQKEIKSYILVIIMDKLKAEIVDLIEKGFYLFYILKRIILIPYLEILQRQL